MSKWVSPDSEVAAPQQHAAASLSALIESTEDLIWSVDLNFGLQTFNRATQRHLERNFGSQAAIGDRPEDVLPPERAALWSPLYRRALSQGPFRIEVPFPDGRTLEISFNPIVVDGMTTGISMFGRDVTESQRAERELRELAEFLRETQRIGAIGSYVFDIRSGLWTGSDVLDELFGVGRGPDHTIESWIEIIHPEDRAMMCEHFNTEVIGKGKIFDKEFRIVRATDKAERWLHAMGKLELDAHGQPLKMRGVIKDVTERRRVELALSSSEKLFRAVTDASPLAIHISSGNEQWGEYMNPAFTRIFGYTRDDIPSVAAWWKLAYPNENYRDRIKEEWDRRVAHAIQTHTAIEPFESVVTCKDGSEKNIVWGFVDVGERNFSYGLDLTERKLADLQLRASEERYRATFEQAAIGIVLVTFEGQILKCNARFAEIVGYTPQEASRLNVIQLTEPGYLPECLPILQSLKDGSADTAFFEKRYIRKDGSLIWVRLTVSKERDSRGKALHLISFVEDINALKAAEHRLAATGEALRVSEERYRTVFQTSLDAILISRVDNGKIIDVNRAFLDALGFERDEVIERTTRELRLWEDSRDRDNLLHILSRTFECRNMEIQFRRKSGETLWALVSASIIEVEGQRCVLAIARDISNAKAAQAEIRNLAFYDSLTGLPNRRLLLERLRQALVVSNRNGRMRALLFVDLDNFKTLNDTLGHQTGDLLLQEAARRLKSCIRDIDAVGRLGGDEFVLMLEDLSELPEDAAAQSKAVAEKILTALGQPCLLAGREYCGSASIGISVFGDSRESTSEVLQQADIAMYQAKLAGRNTMRFFAPALQAAVNARAEMEEELRQGIKGSQFVLYYQPQIDRNRLVGAEALIRWNHPRRNVLLPGEFIPMAEETGLILPLGRWVLQAACEQIAAWAGRRQTVRLSIAVNISASQFRQPDFVQQVLSALHSTGANPRNLGLELTESMLAENIEEVIEKMKELKSHGLRFSLDDFGTGFSSLAYLKRLPLNQLKIDGSFIRDILTDESSAAIAQTIVSLSRAMGLPVVAEGVETEQQREFLTRMGCHAFQGHTFSRPLPLDEFESQWLPSIRFGAQAAR
jgi:diguanylate cyclase (GGDEF)-like protein/PAS domain S-box-containing protein